MLGRQVGADLILFDIDRIGQDATFLLLLVSVLQAIESRDF